MADFANNANVNNVTIKRVSPGIYFIGARKVTAKIISGKLVIRLGGGYTGIEEYIQTYADKDQYK